MKIDYEIGDLVHIPQAVRLVDCHTIDTPSDQLPIPSRILETSAPKLGVVTDIQRSGYIQVYCEGDSWSVLDTCLYKI
jgi:hypothetical protein